MRNINISIDGRGSLRSNLSMLRSKESVYFKKIKLIHPAFKMSDESKSGLSKVKEEIRSYDKCHISKSQIATLFLAILIITIISYNIFY